MNTARHHGWVFAPIAALALLTATPLLAQDVRAPSVSIAPASRAETVQSAAFGLPDQQFHHVTFRRPLTASLITVANLGGTGHRSFLVVANLVGGGTFSFQAKEGGEDITLAMAQPVPLTGVSVRCDSFSAVNCRYEISVVGN